MDPREGLKLFISQIDGKLQWEEEAAVNRLQSSEVPVFPGGGGTQPGCGVKGGRNQEVLKSPLTHGFGIQSNFFWTRRSGCSSREISRQWILLLSHGTRS